MASVKNRIDSSADSVMTTAIKSHRQLVRDNTPPPQKFPVANRGRWIGSRFAGYFRIGRERSQTSCINFPIVILGVTAIRSMFRSATFRSPRSIPPMYVGPCYTQRA